MDVAVVVLQETGAFFLACLAAPAKIATTQYLSSIRCAGLLGAPAVQRAWSGCVVVAEHAPRPPGRAGPRNQAPMPPWYVNKK